MLKNNDFGHDTQDVRSERADLMTENIDALAGDLGLIAPSSHGRKKPGANSRRHIFRANFARTLG